MTRPLQIWLLGDGRAGHLNQSLGLAEAIGRRTPVQVEKIAVPTGSPLRRIRASAAIVREFPAPDLLFGAGHRTHLPMIWLGRKTKARTVVLMRPTLPTGLFDLCLVPRHDLTRADPPANVVPTIGALNRVRRRPGANRSGRLILIGGPSGQHGWDGDPPGRRTARNHRRPDPLGDHRLPPHPGRVPQVAGKPRPELDPPPAPTNRSRLAGRKLATADTVWVTEDSVSMVCEALTAGARVGILPMPRTRKRSRVVRGLEMLADDGYVTTLDQWRESRQLATAPARLAEADRAAAIVLERSSRPMIHPAPTVAEVVRLRAGTAGSPNPPFPGKRPPSAGILTNSATRHPLLATSLELGI